MREHLFRLLNYFLFVLALLLLSALQTSLWFQVFGWFPAPQLWLTILVFWVLYRDGLESIVMLYLVALVLTAFTVRPFSHLLLANVLTALTLAYAQRRVYWAGSTFYMLACGAGALAFPVVSFLISWRYDRNLVFDLGLLPQLLSVLLTMLLSLPLHWLYSRIDTWTHRHQDAGVHSL